MKAPLLVNGGKFVAIDFGSFSLKIAVYCLINEQIKCIFYKEDPEVNIDSPDEKIIQPLISIREKFPDAVNCGISISPTKSFVRYIKAPIFCDKEREKYVMEFEVKNNIPYAIEDILWDYEIYESNGENNCKLTVVKKEDVYPIIRSVKLLGFKISFIETALESTANLTQYNRRQINYADTICNINIGHKSTIISLCNLKTMKNFIRTVPLAGEKAIREISYEMGVSENWSINSLDKINLMLGHENHEHENVVTYNTVKKIMSSLCYEINKSISIYKVIGGSKPDIIIMSGGMTRINGISEFFESKLQIKTFIFKASPETAVLDGISYRFYPEFKCLCDVDLFHEDSERETFSIIKKALPKISPFISKKIKILIRNQSISINPGNKSNIIQNKEFKHSNNFMSRSKIKKYLPEYKPIQIDVKSPEDRMLRILYKFSYDLSEESDVAEKFYLMLHGFFHKGD